MLIALEKLSTGWQYLFLVKSYMKLLNREGKLDLKPLKRYKKIQQEKKLIEN